MTVRAIRGAIQVESDGAATIVAGATELLTAVLSDNDLVADDVISILFTLTPDLTAAFPAVAARRLGLVGVPLMCATEVAVPGSLPHVIRLMAHVHTPLSLSDVRHVYLGGAQELRPDLVRR